MRRWTKKTVLETVDMEYAYAHIEFIPTRIRWSLEGS